MTDYNVEGRLITKDDWEKWLKMKEENLDRHLANITEPSAKKESRYAVIEWHKYPQEMLEAEERRRLKEEYEAEIRKDQEVMKNDKN